VGTKKEQQVLLPYRIERRKMAVIIAMQKSLGVITKACQLAEISRATFYDWYNTDPAFSMACDETKDIAIDFVESKMFEKIGEGSEQLIKFYLEKKGDLRGYGKKEDTRKDINVNINLSAEDTEGQSDNEDDFAEFEEV